MRAIWGTALTVLATVAASQSFAAEAYKTGNELLQLCRSDLAANQAICLGYITGVADALESNDAAVAKDGRDGDKRRVCVSTGVTIGQLQRVVVKYITDHSENLDYNASDLVASALARDFPC